MDSTVAILPCSARSKISPPARGQSRTRSPRRTCTPRISNDSTGALSSRSCHSHSFMASLLSSAQAAQGSVQFLELLIRHGFRALQNFARAVIRTAHFLLFFVCHGQNTQRQNFVDLRAVEEIAGAFRSNLRVIVENDRRREHGVALAVFSNKNRPGSDVLAGCGKFAALFRRIDQRYKFAAACFQNGVGGNQCSRKNGVTADGVGSLDA